MLVETFEVNELVADPLENNEKQLELIQQLDLEGQKSLIGASSNKTLCMYKRVTREQSYIIGTLCPQKTPVASYKNMQIPLRILQVIAHCQQENYFKNLWVFDKEDERVKDPFLVGETARAADHQWGNGDFYLLGRWGEELESWQELTKKADLITRAKLEEFVEEAKHKLDGMLKFGAENVYIGNFNRGGIQ